MQYEVYAIFRLARGVIDSRNGQSVPTQFDAQSVREAHRTKIRLTARVQKNPAGKKIAGTVCHVAHGSGQQYMFISLQLQSTIVRVS